MIARTTREAFGYQLPPEAFRDDDTTDRPVIIVSFLAALVFAGLWGGGLLVDRFNEIDAHELIQQQCTMIDSLANDRKTMLWTCKDGYRVSSTDVIDAL